MLVLTRKREEKITIGNNPGIVITVLKIQGDKVSIGIEASPEIPVFRTELLSRERPQKNEGISLQTEIPIESLQIDLEKQKFQLNSKNLN